MEIIARLAGEPWLMPKDEIERLDPWWILNVLFYPRDSEGKYLPMPDAPEPDDGRPKNPKEAFFRKHFLLGLPDWVIEKLWEDEQRGGRA